MLFVVNVIWTFTSGLVKNTGNLKVASENNVYNVFTDSNKPLKAFLV